ncbi:MAG: hypothetical protein H6531_03295 [Actinobacteria bacterium]|nr:hypothetical protein [Actinomycetota bacterium]
MQAGTIQGTISPDQDLNSMPVPRVFEASTNHVDHWVHVLGTLLQLGTPDTRAALVSELCGDPLDGTDRMQVSERRAVKRGDSEVVVDLVLRNGSDWVVGVVAALGFGLDHSDRVTAAADALSGLGAASTQVILLVPDRRAGDLVDEGGSPRITQKSWLRVRDWVQERPERGNAQGTDLVLLREAEYFYTPRVAELYRLEDLAPTMDAAVRAEFTEAYLDLNDLAPAPTILTPADGRFEVAFPRTGDQSVRMTAGGGAPTVSVNGGPSVTLDGPDAYQAQRGAVVSAARAALPNRK